jgi:Flp pilus assembly protein TadG
MHLTRLRSRTRARLGSPERGATSVLVIILLVPVLFGAAALSIDVGSLMWERRQLQNGSDAAVTAAAQVCAETPTQCPTGATPALTTLAGANARDNAATVTSVCGNPAAQASVTGLSLCASAGGSPPANPGITDCPVVPASLSSSTPYIELRTETKTSSGGNSLTSKIASVVAGTQVNTSVKSCSRAAWGPVAPGSLTVFPIVMSYCDWAHDTGYTGTAGSATYPPGPLATITPYGYGPANPWTTIAEKTVYTKGNEGTCTTWNGHTAPGNFYSINSGGCTTNSVVGGWVQATTGNSSPCSNMTTPSGVSILGTVIYIPVFDCLSRTDTTVITSTTNCNDGSGSNTYYHIMGYAAFYVTGWYFSNTTQSSIKSGSAPCNGGDRCMSGWFLKDLVSEGDITTPTPGGPPNLGLNVVKPVG